ncbi:MAG: DUF937 domain-containing protein [Bacteroidota bacterium]
MAGILDILGPALSGGTLQQLSSAVGTDDQTTQRAAMAALPVILGAMNRNTNDPQQAQSLASALERDHDGGILDNLGGFLGGLTGAGAPSDAAGVNARAANGTGILGHIFGNQLSQVQQGVGKATGLDSGQVMKMMVALAPMVMGYLGRQKRQQNLNAGGLSDLLGREASNARSAAPNDLMGMLGGLLDRDGDGSPIDDVLGGLLGKR